MTLLAAFFGWPPSEYERLTPGELQAWVANAKKIANARKKARSKP